MWWSVPDGIEDFHPWREVTTVFHEGVPGHHLQVAQTAYRSDTPQPLAAADVLVQRPRRGVGALRRAADGRARLPRRPRRPPRHARRPVPARRARHRRHRHAPRAHHPRRQPARSGGTAFHPGETWTPELGLEFMRLHCRMDDEVIQFEVKRYLGLPGQAPSYKVGERIWLEARAEVQAAPRRRLRPQGLPPRRARPRLARARPAAHGAGAPVTTARVPLVLASASPARLATLRAAGIEPVVIVSGVDETQVDGLPPAELALQLAELKCAAVAARDDVPRDALVLGCDSVLGQARGARRGARQAPRRCRGRVSGGVRCAGAAPSCTAGTACATWRRAGWPRRPVRPVVHFADVSDDEVEAYVATGEPLHVAGAFTIDGFGGAFVTRDRGRSPQRGGREPAAAARAGPRARPRVA